MINTALRHEIAARAYDAIIMSRPGVSHAAALDPYLAGLVAYATIIGLSGRPGWRNALWLAVGVYGLVHLAATDTTLLSFLLTLLVGRTIGLAVRVRGGRPVAASQRGRDRVRADRPGPEGDRDPLARPGPQGAVQ